MSDRKRAASAGRATGRWRGDAAGWQTGADRRARGEAAVILGAAVAIFTAFLWALTSMMVKLERTPMSAVALNAYRVSFATVVFVVIFLLTRDPATLVQVPARAVIGLMVAVLCAMVGAATLSMMAIRRIGLGRAFPISGAFPLGTLLLSAVFLDEGIGWPEIVGGLVILSGVTLVGLPARNVAQPSADRRSDLIGVGMAATAAVLWATASIITKIALVDLDLVTASVIRLPTAAVALLVLTLVGPPQPPPWKLPPRSLLLAAVGGLLGPALSSFSWMLGIQLIGVARTDVLTSTSPIFAVGLAALALGERLHWRVLVGTLLSVAGMMLIV